MKTQTEWLRSNRTLIGALAVTIAMVILIVTGHMAVSRAVVALSFCWVLALHSWDQNDHKADMIQAAKDLAQAGEDYRMGRIQEGLAHPAQDSPEIVTRIIRNAGTGTEKS